MGEWEEGLALFDRRITDDGRAISDGVLRAAILQNGVVPLCSLLLPVLAMRGVVGARERARRAQSGSEAPHAL